MSELVFPDVMLDVRYWLRNDPTLNPLHGGRVFWRFPDRNLVAPLQLISQVGGGPQLDSEAPIEDIQMTVQTWGLQNADYQAVRQLDLALKSVCQQYPAGRPMNPTGNTRLHNARFNTSFDSPDGPTGWPRKIAHITLTVSATTPTIV